MPQIVSAIGAKLPCFEQSENFVIFVTFSVVSFLCFIAISLTGVWSGCFYSLHVVVCVFCCSALVYLNNDFVGGNFFFTHQNMSLQVSRNVCTVQERLLLLQYFVNRIR